RQHSAANTQTSQSPAHEIQCMRPQYPQSRPPRQPHENESFPAARREPAPPPPPDSEKLRPPSPAPPPPASTSPKSPKSRSATCASTDPPSLLSHTWRPCRSSKPFPRSIST